MSECDAAIYGTGPSGGLRAASSSFTGTSFKVEKELRSEDVIPLYAHLVGRFLDADMPDLL